MFKVRVCDGCYATLQKPSSGTLKRNEGPNDLPAEYLNSSLAQQSQVCKTNHNLFSSIGILQLQIGINKNNHCTYQFVYFKNRLRPVKPIKN